MASGKVKSMPSASLLFEGKSMRFIVLNEQAEHSAAIVEHSVEEGANVSDHVRPEADRLSLQVLISKTPVKDLNGYGMQVAGLELKVEKFDRPVYPTPGSLMNAGLNAIGDFLNPPSPVVASVQQWPPGLDIVKDEVTALLDWKDRAVVGEVITAWRDYKDMVIVGVNVGRTSTTGDAVEVTIELKKIRLVEVGMTTIPIPSEVRGNQKINKGRQPTDDLPDGPRKSTAKFAADKLRGR